MAVRSGAGTGVIVSLVVFVLTTVFMLVLALVFYAGKTKAIESQAGAETELARFVRKNEQVTDQFQRFAEAATANRQSVTGHLAAQNEELMRLANGDGSASLDQFRADLARFGLAEGESLRQAFENTSRSLRASQAEIEGMTAQLQSRDEDLAEFETRFDSLRESHKQELVDVSRQIEKYKTEAEEFRELVDTTVEEISNAKNRLEDEYSLRVADLEDEIDRISQDNTLLRDRLEELQRIVKANQQRQATPELLVDGRVIEVDPLNEQVFIDRGRKDHIVLGMTFEVYDDFSALRVNPVTGEISRGKASIQVVKVGETTSTAKIIRRVPGRPVVRENVIANAIYDPDYTFKFLVHGKFDVDGDGRPTEAEAEYLRGVVVDWGGEIVLGRELPGDLDFLVLGEKPPMPAPLPPDAKPHQIEFWAEQRRVRQEYENLFQQAREAQIPVLNANRFFILIGRSGR
jgi:hypothetical protein